MSRRRSRHVLANPNYRLETIRAETIRAETIRAETIRALTMRDALTIDMCFTSLSLVAGTTGDRVSRNPPTAAMGRRKSLPSVVIQ